MSLENTLKKVVMGSFLVAGLAFNSINAEPQTNTIENYFRNQTSQYLAKGDTTKALATEYRMEQIEKAKKTFERNGGSLYSVQLKEDYGWSKAQIGIAAGWILASALESYQSCHVPEGFEFINGDLKKKAETGKLYLFNWNNSPLGPQRFFGNRPTKGQMAVYTTLSDLAWLALCDQVPKHVTNHFLPKRYNKYVRDGMLLLSFASSACNGYNNEKITGGIIFKF